METSLLRNTPWRARRDSEGNYHPCSCCPDCIQQAARDKEEKRKKARLEKERKLVVEKEKLAEKLKDPVKEADDTEERAAAEVLESAGLPPVAELLPAAPPAQKAVMPFRAADFAEERRGGHAQRLERRGAPAGR